MQAEEDPALTTWCLLLLLLLCSVVVVVGGGGGGGGVQLLSFVSSQNLPHQKDRNSCSDVFVLGKKRGDLKSSAENVLGPLY